MMEVGGRSDEGDGLKVIKVFRKLTQGVDHGASGLLENWPSVTWHLDFHWPSLFIRVAMNAGSLRAQETWTMKFLMISSPSFSSHPVYTSRITRILIQEGGPAIES